MSPAAAFRTGFYTRALKKAAQTPQAVRRPWTSESAVGLRAWVSGTALAIIIFLVFAIIFQLMTFSREQGARLGYTVERLASIERNISEVNKQFIQVAESFDSLKADVAGVAETAARSDKSVADLTAATAATNKFLDDIKKQQSALTERLSALEGAKKE
jgi:septal ring factor EnvC (AmiA/AmiB activator)